MTRAIKAMAVVQDGGIVQIVSSELEPGARVEVIVLELEQGRVRSIDEILAGYPGGQLFRSAEEVDAYLRAERDSWDR